MPGVIVGERIISAASIGLPSDVVPILAGGPALWQEAQARAEAEATGADAQPVDEVRLHAPVERPPKFFGVGFNSASHREELEAVSAQPEFAQVVRAAHHTKLAFPDPPFPTFFNKQSTCVTGPFDPIWMPYDSTQLDYEGELAVVIGRRARRLTPAAARDVIAGYTVCNDVSVRDWQGATPVMWPGKSFDTHGPIGPWVVTRDEAGPENRVISTYVNGELRQRDTTDQFISSPIELVAHLSRFCTLEPGDVVATGTPGGIGLLRGQLLEIGDCVRVEIEGIGAIVNEVIAEPGNEVTPGSTYQPVTDHA